MLRIPLSILICIFSTITSLEAADGPCSEDAKRLCQGIAVGGGRILQCLKEKRQQLNPACRAHLTQWEARTKELREVCQGDRNAHCKDVPPGGIMQCLRENDAKLSPGCKNEIQKIKQRQSAGKKS
ncbi:MAG: hypothetical protein HY537_09585 [Deltaproteobacteria bacterium]|nr:hypothetical protein [Deltaproteobacteria bacterium]